MFIIGLLLASGGILFTKISQNQNFKQAQLVTLDRQDKIYKAILNYLSENHRLPCPARLNSSYSDSDYGQESRTSGTCNDSDSGWEFRGNSNPDPANYENDARNLGGNDSMEILYGMVPIDVLNLDKDDAEDGYGNKFSYVMIKEFGVKTTSNTSLYGFEYFAGSDRLGENLSTPSVVDYISIKSRESGTNSTLLDKAIMLLISHGENGKGAYIPDSAMQKSIANITNEENKNIHNASYGRVFFTNSDETTTENQEIITFDDHLLFKTKDQLLRDAEMEFVKCGIEQGFINQNYNSQLSELESCLSEDFIPSNNSTYGQTIDITNISNPNTSCGCNDDDAILQITCGKYGKWSDIFCNESYKINVVDEVRADSDQGLNLSDDSGTNGIFVKDGGEMDATHLITSSGGIKAKGAPGSSFYSDTETSVNIGTLNNQYALIEMNSSNEGGGWIDFTDASGTDMKGRIKYVNSSNQFQFFTAGALKMVLNSSGNVGIGTTSPSRKLDVNGTAGGTSAWQSPSDKRYKENIKPIQNILPKINKLVAIYYDWKKQDFPYKNFPDKRQVGFIAQEMEEIFPELVYTDKRGYKSVAYSKITPILLQAIKELQLQNTKEIEGLRKKYDQKINELTKRIKKLENDK